MLYKRVPKVVDAYLYKNLESFFSDYENKKLPEWLEKLVDEKNIYKQEIPCLNPINGESEMSYVLALRVEEDKENMFYCPNDWYIEIYNNTYLIKDNYTKVKLADKENFEKEYEQASYQQVKSGEFTESCSDKQIVLNCISLMDELVSEFEDYLEFINFLPEDKEETFSTSFSYFHIIQKLLLWGTNHSGGTSTRQKCKELGYDSTEGVIFKDKRYEADF